MFGPPRRTRLPKVEPHADATCAGFRADRGDGGKEDGEEMFVRRRWGKGLRAVAATWLVLVGCAANPTQPSGGGEGILFIGNSLTYSNDLPGMLAALLQEGGGESVVVDAEASPNAGLPDHWMFGGARDRIRAGGWSVVILQQGPSATEGRPFLLDYAELFAGEIRAAGAEPALYMVWPSIQRFADFDGVLDSYRTAAENVDGIFFPAGEAWRVAWESDPDLPLYGSDGFHPSVLGTYLAALVMYEQLTGRDPRDLPATIPGSGAIDAGLALQLQEAAREANARHAR